MKKIAIILTGQIRTIDKTMKFLLKNIVQNNPNANIFAVLEMNPKQQHQKYYDNVIKNTLGNHLKSLIWISHNEDYNFIRLRNNIIYKNKDISPNYYSYLKTSGTIIEHWDAHIAHLCISEYEKENSINYDFIVRIRTDVIITRKINFNFDEITECDIVNRLIEISISSNGESKTNLFNRKNIIMFMNSLIDYEYRIRGDFSDNMLETHPDTSIEDVIASGSPKLLKKYIQDGKYILCIRKNNFFIIKRQYYEPLGNLIFKYGTYKEPNTGNHFWDSETQFLRGCIHNGIDFFSSTTHKEDSSLYGYKTLNFFKEDEKSVLDEDPNILFFICRF